MAPQIRLHQITSIKTRINSKIDISPNQQFLAILTRERALDSSKWVYYLQIYDLQTLDKEAEKVIYETYNEQKHNLVVLADNRSIVVATVYEIIFYSYHRDEDTEKIAVEYRVLHEQANVYGICASPDGKMTGIVGDNSVLLLELPAYRTVVFSYKITNPRSCQFSNNMRYFALSTSSQIIHYEIINIRGVIEFVNQQITPEDVGNGIVSSFVFNPQNSQEVVVGFSNVSPRVYRFDNSSEEFERIFDSRQQPQYYDNYKEVAFMPDAKRVISSDYREGIGLWPGDQSSTLTYREDYLLFDLHPFAQGRKVIGYAWQRIKVIQIQVKCQESGYSTKCTCPQNQYWDTSMYQCVDCPRPGCQCPVEWYFHIPLGKCVIDCSSKQHSIVDSPPSDSFCLCQLGYSWSGLSCVFNCRQIALARGYSSATRCECGRGFVWDPVSKSCKCGQYKFYDNDSLYTRFSACTCAEGFTINQTTNQCVLNCALIPNAKGHSVTNTSKCECEDNHIFLSSQSLASGVISYSCQYNCSISEHTLPGINFDGSCQCEDNRDWNPQLRICMINCKKIKNTDTAVYNEEEIPISCICPINYLWTYQNIECGKNCTQIAFANTSKPSSAQACPCLNNFSWNYFSSKCEINCQSINFTQSYSIANQHTCICQTLFSWEPQQFKCVVNCNEIWDAEQTRISEGQCKCKNQKFFNPQKLQCESKADDNVFSQPWVWVVLVVGITFLVVVAVVLGKFCWSFSKKNKVPGKRLKKTGNTKKKRAVKNQNAEIDKIQSERMQLNKQ